MNKYCLFRMLCYHCLVDYCGIFYYYLFIIFKIGNAACSNRRGRTSYTGGGGCIVSARMSQAICRAARKVAQISLFSFRIVPECSRIVPR